MFRIGDIAFASNRFELYMDYQHGFKHAARLSRLLSYSLQDNLAKTEVHTWQPSGECGAEAIAQVCSAISFHLRADRNWWRKR